MNTKFQELQRTISLVSENFLKLVLTKENTIIESHVSMIIICSHIQDIYGNVFASFSIKLQLPYSKEEEIYSRYFEEGYNRISDEINKYILLGKTVPEHGYLSFQDSIKAAKVISVNRRGMRYD